MIWTALFGFLPLLIWTHLLLFRGMFWLARERDDDPTALREPGKWPS